MTQNTLCLTPYPDLNHLLKAQYRGIHLAISGGTGSCRSDGYRRV